ncbi:hypothetical protein EUGRSUZ_J01065 [Eucalyptus grandis]|uniref:Uncharacterized protein n=2 Tax=Eucalyptus grandis TaxID=71139 RepID=A0ACC3J4J6_EUCGR|nr:hypothetical protein EUGRSUZ_J01065 [Eucalyptus grandis]
MAETPQSISLQVVCIFISFNQSKYWGKGRKTVAVADIKISQQVICIFLSFGQSKNWGKRKENCHRC